MTPSQVADILRKIAAGIENSKQPDRTLVAADLKKLISHIQEEQPKTETK